MWFQGKRLVHVLPIGRCFDKSNQRPLTRRLNFAGISAAYIAVLEEGSPAPEPTEDGEEPEEPPEEEESEEEPPEEDGPDDWYNVPEENPNPEKPTTEPGEEEPGEEEKPEEKEEGEEEEVKPTGPDYTSTQLWYTVVNGGDEGAVLGKKLTRAQVGGIRGKGRSSTALMQL